MKVLAFGVEFSNKDGAGAALIIAESLKNALRVFAEAYPQTRVLNIKEYPGPVIADEGIML